MKVFLPIDIISTRISSRINKAAKDAANPLQKVAKAGVPVLCHT